MLHFYAVRLVALAGRASHDAAVPSSLRLDLLDLLSLCQGLRRCVARLPVYWSRAGVLVVEEPDRCFEIVALACLRSFLRGTWAVAGLGACADSSGHRVHCLHHCAI